MNLLIFSFTARIENNLLVLFLWCELLKVNINYIHLNVRVNSFARQFFAN